MPDTYKVTLSDGRAFTVTTEGGPPAEADILASLQQPDFRQEVKASDSPLNLVTGAAKALNPLPAISAAGNALLPASLGFTGPVATAKQIGAAQGAVFDKAKAAYQQGDYLTAARHFVDYLLPIVGPALDESSDLMQKGQHYEGAGRAVGLGLSMFGPQAIGELSAKVPGTGVVKNPADAAAVAFGESRGIPIDAATATGNRAVKAVQHLADRSLAGSVVAEKAAERTNAALAQTGNALAAAVHPEALTAEQAGAATHGALGGLIRDLHQQANTAYGKLRDLEAQTSADVAAPIPVSAAMKARMSNTLGSVPSQSELQELRNIGEELKAVPYQRGRQVSETETPTGSSYYARGQANAPVYHDILQAAPGTSAMTGADMQQSIEAAVNTGVFNNAAKGALAVARERLAGSRQVSSPMLVAPGEGTVTQTMAMPVDLREVKTAIQPVYDRLKREAELVPLMGGKAQTLTALDRIMTGPDHAPLSVADAALSDLKSLARSDDPALRTVAQGRAAYAVKNLDAAVRQAATQAGPEAVNALEEGRAATAAKYATAAIRDTLHEEPVRAFRQLTAPKDSAIGQLRQVAELAPQAMPQIGRAVLEDMLGRATEAGGFDHAAKLYADWQKIGPQTKQILFGPTTSDLDNFFLLAKRLSETPNPSGTAHTLAAGAQIASLANPYTFLPAVASQLGAGGLAALLHSPTGVRLLTKGVRLSLGKAPQAVQAAAWADVVNAARAQGLGGAVPVPAAAGQPTGAQR